MNPSCMCTSIGDKQKKIGTGGKRDTYTPQVVSFPSQSDHVLRIEKRSAHEILR